MKRSLFLTLVVIVASAVPVMAQGSGTYAGVSQCFINNTWVTVNGNCPAPAGGSSSANTPASAPPALNPAVYNGLNQAGYQLGYAFGRWLFGGGSNPQANAQAEWQRQQMMQELARRAAEAERLHQEEEARRIAAMYNRLNATLKLSGLPDLHLKDISTNGPGLSLKLGDNSDGQAGVKGLPGIYLNDGKTPYGIQGLPGIYTDGPGQGSGLAPLSESKLQLKTGDSETGAPPAASSQAAVNPTPVAPAADPNAVSSPAPATESKLQLKTGDGNDEPISPAQPAAPSSPATPDAQAATFDPSKMTPQQLADVAEMVSKLPPEEQQRLMAAAQKDAGAGQPSAPGSALSPQTAAQPVASLAGQASASRAAATAAVPEDASAKARVGFDQSAGPAAAPLGLSGSTPALLRPPETAATANLTPAAPPPAPSSAAPSPVANEWVKQYLFPASQTAGLFPADPNPLLNNPIRDEQKLQAELKACDDWALQRATHIAAGLGDKLYPGSVEQIVLNTSAVKQYSPDLLNRYDTDAAFRQSVDQRLEYTNEHVALDYYQGIAGAHKAAVLAYQAEIDKLTAAGTLDKLTPLEDQYRLHPERRQIVQAIQARVSADEQAALARAQAEGSSKVDKEYQSVFQLIRGEAAQ